MIYVYICILRVFINVQICIYIYMYANILIVWRKTYLTKNVCVYLYTLEINMYIHLFSETALCVFAAAVWMTSFEPIQKTQT